MRLEAQCWGTPSEARDNVVPALHALTGDAHVSGPPGPARPPWLVAASSARGARWIPGTGAAGGRCARGCRGSTGTASPHPEGGVWGGRFPEVSIRDQVAAEAALADVLGIGRFAAVVGGSMGGARTLEWAIGYPDRVGAALVLAVGARATADQWARGPRSSQRSPATPTGRTATTPAPDAVRGPGSPWPAGSRISPIAPSSTSTNASGTTGSPRTPVGLRGQLSAPPGTQAGRPLRPGHLRGAHQGPQRSRRGPGAGAWTPRWPSSRADGRRGDRQRPALSVAVAARAGSKLPGCRGLEVISSRQGHDGFLTETEAVGTLLAGTLRLAGPVLRTP